MSRYRSSFTFKIGYYENGQRLKLRYVGTVPRAEDPKPYVLRMHDRYGKKDPACRPFALLIEERVQLVTRDLLAEEEVSGSRRKASDEQGEGDDSELDHGNEMERFSRHAASPTRPACDADEASP